MKARWVVLGLIGIAVCALIGGCAGMQPDRGGCTGPTSFCNVYGN